MARGVCRILVSTPVNWFFMSFSVPGPANNILPDRFDTNPDRVPQPDSPSRDRDRTPQAYKAFNMPWRVSLTIRVLIVPQ